MKKAKVGFIKTVHYFCLGGIAVLGLITMIATGGGGSNGKKTEPLVTVTGIVDDGIPNSPIRDGWCGSLDPNSFGLREGWVVGGRYTIRVPPDKEGYIQCSPSNMQRLRLCTFVSTKGYEDEDTISGEHVTLNTTVVASIIAHEEPADPQALKDELLDAIENGDRELNQVVDLLGIMWNAMLNAQINVNLGGGPGDGPGDGPGTGAGGDAGDGGDFSPIPNARCDFALDLEGKVLYSSALEDLRDGELNRPDLAAIKEEVEEKIKDLKSEIKIALDNKFPDGVGIPYLDIADENGRYFLPIPPNVQGYVRCSPPDQPKLKLATLVPKLQEGEKKDDQNVTPATTIFSHSIATELSGDLDTVKENYLDDILGLGDIQIIKDGETITGFQLKDTSVKDKNVGLVAFSAASLFNILYKNGMDVDYLAALDGLIDNQEVRSEDLEDLEIPKEDAEKWSEVVNTSNVDAGKDLDPTNPVILGDALSKARIKVTVLDWLDGEGILGAEVDITDAPSGVVCENCPGETDENGEVTLTLTGVKTEPAEITVKTSGVSGFIEKQVKTKVVAFATVDLEIVMTSEFLLQVTKSGTGDGTVTSSPAGINCGADCEEDYIEGTEVSLTADAYTYSDFTGWSGGGCSETGDCTVTMNQAHTVIATFTLKETGSLKVTILPSAVVSAGAQWSVDGGSWQNSGVTQSDLSVGSHTVDYKPVTGWTGPNPETVTIIANQTTTTSGTYVFIPPTGSLKVTILPSTAVSAGAQWRVDGGSWRNSGYTQSGLSVGSHRVEFKPVTGWTEPDPENVTISDGQTTSISRTYRQLLTPPELNSPRDGAEMDNNCEDLSDSIDWDFSWESVSGATRYHIYVIGPSASYPVVDSIVTSLSYNYSSTGYIADSSRLGWTWRVRAGNDSGEWSDWSERSFDIEPLNTDCPFFTLTVRGGSTGRGYVTSSLNGMSCSINGTDESGSTVSSSVYFYMLIADEATVTRKMVLLR